MEDVEGTRRGICGDHVMPLMRMVQRSIMWTVGLGDAFFRGKQARAFQKEDEATVDDNLDEVEEGVSRSGAI
jgi:hypothetical protein